MRFPTREFLDRLLAIGGAVVILIQVAFITSSRIDVSIVLVGIIVNQIGVWSLASRLLRERRTYALLRSEVRHFLGLVCQLNEHAVAGDAVKVEATHTSMLESVERMVPIAAIPEGQSVSERQTE
jgi:hypothetical protein